MGERAECIYECGNQAKYWAWQTTNTWHPICYDCLPQWWDGDRCEGCNNVSGHTCEKHRRQGYPNPWYRVWTSIPAGYYIHHTDDRRLFATGVGLKPHPHAAEKIRDEFLALIGLDTNLKENTDA